MAHVSKRRKAFVAKVDRSKAYPAMEALKLVKDTAYAKFDESVELHIRSGLDPRHALATQHQKILLCRVSVVETDWLARVENGELDPEVQIGRAHV